MMKNKTYFSILLIVSLGCCLTTCKDKTETSQKTAPSTVLEIENEREQQAKPVIEEKSVAPDKFSSPLRPNEVLELGKVFKDTIKFVSFDDNYDYWYFLAQKNKDIIKILYKDENLNTLSEGDSLEINWKMTRLEEAGDPEITYVKPFLVSFRKISSVKLSDKKVKVLWREDLYDEDLETEVNTIVLNIDYLKNIHKLEKAALAYVATFIGNECEWDGKANENRSNLKCKLISQLGLGYQCSTEHLSFLHTWFSNDPEIVEKLKKCPTIPNTATIQSTFDEIELITNSENQTIVINYKATNVNVRENSASSYTKTKKFKYNLDNTTQLHVVRTENDGLSSNSNKKNSFVISCGSGCAMTYSENKIVTLKDSKEVTFKVEMYINEKLSDEYDVTYIFDCATSSEEVKIKLKGDDDYKIEEEHVQMQEKLKSYQQLLCKK